MNEVTKAVASRAMARLLAAAALTMIAAVVFYIR